MHYPQKNTEQSFFVLNNLQSAISNNSISKNFLLIKLQLLALMEEDQIIMGNIYNIGEKIFLDKNRVSSWKYYDKRQTNFVILKS